MRNDLDNQLQVAEQTLKEQLVIASKVLAENHGRATETLARKASKLTADTLAVRSRPESSMSNAGLRALGNVGVTDLYRRSSPEVVNRPRMDLPGAIYPPQPGMQ